MFRVTVPQVRYPDAVPLVAPTSTGGPLFLLVVSSIPTVVAVYIASTRYTNYKHHGSDILLSSAGGMLCAWLGFRLYHMPLSRGAGQTCKPRSADEAFGMGASNTKARVTNLRQETFTRVGESISAARNDVSSSGIGDRARHHGQSTATGNSDEVELRPYGQ